LWIKDEQIIKGPDFNYEEVGKLMDQGFWMFRLLSEEETEEFIQAARDNYIPFQPMQGIWHPVYQMECVRINHEHALYRKETEEQKQERKDYPPIVLGADLMVVEDPETHLGYEGTSEETLRQLEEKAYEEEEEF